MTDTIVTITRRGGSNNPRGLDLVPNRPIRELMIERGITPSDVSFALWGDRRRSNRIGRALGFQHYQSAGGGKYLQKSVEYHMAVEIIRSVGIDPYEVGL